MKLKLKTVMTTTALVAAMGLPQVAKSEQTQASGAGPLSTAARLDFSVQIPRFLNFRVGSTGATINLVDFNVPDTNVGDGTNVAGTGGDIGGGVVTAAVRSNAGQVTITESNNSGGAGLSNGAGATIPYTEILTATNDGNLPAPTLSNAGGNTSAPVLNSGNVTNRSAQWTYTYDNTAVYDSGTYGTSANGGRVTYTASTP
ncbi:MAG: hypothetical protein L0Z68_01135 [Gammaproteobacteria bacterium]|nr:hypothetical protein [Gammaproteobacteria bacterium]